MRAVLTLGVALLVASCGGSGSEGERVPVQTVDSPPRTTIAGTTLDGRRLSSTAFRGRAVLVNVWASW